MRWTAPLPGPPSRWVVGLVLAGYLVALGTTPAGQGLHLLGHLATAHNSVPLAAPVYRPEPASVGLPVLTTLRRPAAPHRHGTGHAHTHGADRTARHPSDHVVRAVHVHDAPEVPGETSTSRRHRHGDTVHTHETQAPVAPVVPVRVSVDTHQLPEPTPLPSPLSQDAAAGSVPVAALQSINGSVETPPPIARG